MDICTPLRLYSTTPLLMPSLLILAAGVFQDAAFAAGEAIAAVLLDLLEDFVHGGIRILLGRFRIMHLKPWARLQFRKRGAAGEQSLQPYPRLKIQKRKQCAPNVAGE